MVVDEEVYSCRLGEEFLEHSGVKGMRWGVRNSRTGGDPQPDFATRRAIKYGRKQQAKTNAYKEKLKSKGLTNDEIMIRTQRRGKAKSIAILAAVGALPVALIALQIHNSRS